MASLVLYGSDVADGTLTTACDMTINTGGTETNQRSTFGGSSNYGEILSKGGSPTTVSALPAPTGNGWVYKPGAGTFATGNWSASVALGDDNFGGYSVQITIRFYQYSGGTYTAIGTINSGNVTLPAARTVFSLAATSMSTVTFAANDLVYVDLWLFNATGISFATPQVYETTSSTAGLASDVQVTTSSFTAGGVTTTTYAFTDALVVSDLGPALFSWHVDALTATDSPLFTDGDIPVEALSAGDTLLATDTDLPIDANTVSDVGGNLQRWPVDALTVTDSLLGVDVAVPVEGLTGVGVDLNTDVFASIDALSVADSSTMVQTPLLTTTTYSFTDALVVADSFLAVDGSLYTESNSASDSMATGQGGLFTESLATSDSLLQSDGYTTLDALSVSDLGTLARWPVDSLSASDSMAASDSYVPTEVQSVLDGLLATDGAGWVDVLSVSDISTMVSAPPALLLFLSATAVTRDMQATAKTRDMQAIAVTRDENMRATTRDEKATATTRDEQATAKTRG